MTRIMLIAAGLGVLAAAASSGAASAQFYRGKSITMVINYPAGGPTDIEGRIVAQHLPAHIPGKPNVIVKNLGGAGGMIGSNHLGEIAKADGETIGFFTWNPVAQLTGDPGLRVNYSDFVFIAGIENPVIVYVRKDTPPGLKTAADIMKASELKALSLDAHNTNTVQQALSLDLLGVKYKPVVGYRGPQGGRDRDPAERGTTGQLLAAGLARLDRAHDGQAGHRHAVVAGRSARQGRHLSA